jgi:hypothetical protein
VNRRELSKPESQSKSMRAIPSEHTPAPGEVLKKQFIVQEEAERKKIEFEHPKTEVATSGETLSTQNVFSVDDSEDHVFQDRSYNEEFIEEEKIIEEGMIEGTQHASNESSNIPQQIEVESVPNDVVSKAEPTNTSVAATNDLLEMIEGEGTQHARNESSNIPQEIAVESVRNDVVCKAEPNNTSVPATSDLLDNEEALPDGPSGNDIPNANENKNVAPSPPKSPMSKSKKKKDKESPTLYDTEAKAAQRKKRKDSKDKFKGIKRFIFGRAAIGTKGV